MLEITYLLICFSSILRVEAKIFHLNIAFNGEDESMSNTVLPIHA